MSVTVVEINENGTLVSVPDVEEAVQNGIRLLDEQFGTNFHEKIDPDMLDIGSGVSCVCGQLYGSYEQGKNALGLIDEEAKQYGFFGSSSRMAQLTKAWRDALLARSA